MGPSDAVAPYAEHFTRPAAEVVRDLEDYAALLVKWQAVQNLVSRETLPDLWRRHIADSLQVLKLVGDRDRAFIDLGSGGGLPAVPLAIALKGRARFVLVEPTSRKASFLRAVGRALQLDLDVRAMQAQGIDSRETPKPDVITSRALASLGELMALAAPFFGLETKGIFHKGREHGEEIAQARSHWSFDVVIIPSDTNPEAALLQISNLRARSKG